MLHSESLPALEPGTVITGKYRVERVLGRGGMGVVVAATHLELNQDFAIKVLLPTAASSTEAVTRFLREGRSAARLSSPHVTRVHDTGRLASGEPYLVMELLRGRDLQAHLAMVGRVPLGEAVGWILQAAHALAEAHALNIIHRDVKPANLFLAETGTGQRIKILDFGISKQLDSSEVELTKTAAGVGTPRYMAPEQMRSPKLADARGDVWSLGIVLYELTTGEMPFRGDSVTSLCFDVMERTPAPPSGLAPELPPAFDEIIARCLEKDPNDRYPSVDALAAALRGLAVTPHGAGISTEPSLERTVPVAEMRRARASGRGERVDHERRDSSPGTAAPPPAVTVPLAHPLYPDAPPQGQRSSWHTVSLPPPAAKSPRYLPLVALGVGIAVAAATTAVFLSAQRASPSASHPNPTVVSSATPSAATASATHDPTEPVITVSDVPPSPVPTSDSETVSASSPSSFPSQQPMVAPPKAPRPSCNPPFTLDSRGIRIPKPQCLD